MITTPPWWVTAENGVTDTISHDMQDRFHYAESWVKQISAIGYAEEHELPLTKLLVEMAIKVGFIQGLEFADSKKTSVRVHAVNAGEAFEDLHLLFTLEALAAQEKEDLEIDALYRELNEENGQ